MSIGHVDRGWRFTESLTSDIGNSFTGSLADGAAMAGADVPEVPAKRGMCILQSVTLSRV